MMPVGSSSFLLPGLVLFLSATEPDWVLTGSSTQFSHERYLTGRGSADTPEAADDRARADIGRTFSVGVNSAATVTAQARIVSGPGGTQVFGTEGASELIQTTSKVILEGVEIVARFVDPRTKLHHSLAALERSKGLAIIGAKIAAIDRQLQQQGGAARATDSRIDRARAAGKVLRQIRTRSDLEAKYRVLDARGAGMSCAFDLPALMAQATRQFGELRVSVDHSDDNSAAAAVADALSALGIATEKAPPHQGDLLVSVVFRVAPESKNERGGWHWARGNASVTISEVAGNRVVAQFEATDRQASALPEEAARRCRAGLTRKAADSIQAALAGWIGGGP
jgi:hypothetical protein